MKYTPVFSNNSYFVLIQMTNAITWAEIAQRSILLQITKQSRVCIFYAKILIISFSQRTKYVTIEIWDKHAHPIQSNYTFVWETIRNEKKMVWIFPQS